jgi:ABC-type uncharacterized transport system permease subunit
VALTIAGVAALGFGCLCGLMYLAQERRLRRAHSDRLSRALPSLEWLERQNRRAVAAGFVLLTVGLALGLGMLLVKGQRFGFSFFDAKVISSLAVWALFAALAALALRPRMRGRPVALVTVIAFVLMVVTIVGVGLVWPTQHVFGQAAKSAGP